MNRFVKYYQECGMEMIEFTKKHGAARAIFDFLTRHMSKNNSVIIPNQVIADILGMSLSNVNKNLKILKDNNLIKSIRAGGVNVFYINKVIASTLAEGEYRLFKLDTTVILDSKEAKKHAKDMELRESNSKGDIKKR
jgi:DNA-binding transcriptional ArsR family regulator